MRLRGGGLRPGRPRDLPRPQRVADGPQGVGARTRRGCWAGSTTRSSTAGSAQDNVETLAAYSGVPVWNGLTDEWHPTQTLCDMLTMREHSPKHDQEIAFAYCGDARNNVGNSPARRRRHDGHGRAHRRPEVAVEPRRRRPRRPGTSPRSPVRGSPTPRTWLRVSPTSTSSTPTCGSPWGSPRRSGTSASSCSGPTRSTWTCSARPATRTSSSCTACRRSTTGTPRSAQQIFEQTGMDVARGHRRGLRVAALDRVRPGREPHAHDQGDHGRDAGRLTCGSWSRWAATRCSSVASR